MKRDDDERVHREEMNAKKELSLLIYRLKNLPRESRARMPTALM